MNSILRYFLFGLFAFAVVAVAAVGEAHPVGKPIVLEGTVVTPDDVLRNAKVLIEGEIITKVGADVAIPEGSIVVKTNGIISPGLIDLHNHVLWNLFPNWTPPRMYLNRYEWRNNEPAYQTTYRKWNEALKDLQCERNRYGEIKALLGGTTAIQGSIDNSCIRGLVRNLDFNSGLYGSGISEKLYHVLDVGKLDTTKAGELRKKIGENSLTSFLIHLAEGKPTDVQSRLEFGTLSELGLITGATGIIHGTALGPEEFQIMHDRGAKLIWSPRSNLALYGQVTDVMEAVKHNVPIALSPDWSITGSDNMLQELKIARDYNNALPEKVWRNDKELVLQVTLTPARIAAVEGRLGQIKEGYLADLVVIAGDSSEPYSALVNARERDIKLVLIGGQPFYGSPEFMGMLGQATDSSAMDVCGETKLLHLMTAPLEIDYEELMARLRKAAAKAVPPFAVEALVHCQHP